MDNKLTKPGAGGERQQGEAAEVWNQDKTKTEGKQPIPEQNSFFQVFTGSE